MNQTRKLRWVLSHQPVEIFRRTAENFAKEIAKLTNGRIEIDICMAEEFRGQNDRSVIDVIDLINRDIAEISQVQTTRMAKWDAEDFYALDLPFLFDSHEHATRVLDGKIGKGLLDSLAEVTPVTGLAFTYSGGFRCLASSKDITTADDLNGLTMTVDLNPVLVDTAKAFGCVVTPVLVDECDPALLQIRMNSETVDTTLPRYETEANTDIHKFVTNTKHSMFLTTIVISTKIWNSLSDDDKNSMTQAALSSATLERQWTIDEAAELSSGGAKQQKLGFAYRELSAVESDKLKLRTGVLYDKYTQFFTPGLVDGIIKG